MAGAAVRASERRALRFIAMTFFALAAHVTVEGIRDLATASRPDTSIVGIVLTAVSIIVMPWLARAKRRVGQAMNSRLVVADAGDQTMRLALLGRTNDPDDRTVLAVSRL